METLQWEKFKDLIHESWHKDLEKFIGSKECYDIYQYLKSQPSGSVIPKSNLVWEAFKYCKKEDFRILFIGLAPYHTRENRKDIATGLAFATKDEKTPPSLKLIKEAIEDDLGMEGNITNNLEWWAEQGVLLLNAALTTSYLKAGNHVQLWQPFWTWFFREVLSTQNGLIIVYFGNEAKTLEKLSTPFIHYNFVLKHPAYFSRLNQPFEHQKVFSKINTLLKQNNNFEMKWFDKDLPF